MPFELPEYEKAYEDARARGRGVQRRRGVRAFPKRARMSQSSLARSLIFMEFPGYLPLAFCRVTRTDLIPPRGAWNGPRR